MSDVVAALRRGEPVVLPTDTVYGLCCEATARASTERLYALKRRDLSQPSALIAASVADLLAAVPELDRAQILTGPYTSILPNPARRFEWVCGTTPAAIGVRVPDLPRAAADVVRALGVVVGTSANLHGGADPRSLAGLDPELRGLPAVDAGELPGTPSTVVSFTGPEPRVLREGGGPWPRH
jgi:L-threonylcarbamoyladenylate synthase